MFKKRRLLIFFGIGILLIGIGYVLDILIKANDTLDAIHEPIQRDSAKREEEISVKERDPFSVLLLGVDERPNDVGRSDTMIVVTVNPKEKSMKMLSIPRDTYVDIYGRGEKDKINHSYAFGGVEMAVKTVENFLDIPIDYYVKVNMEGFKDIIDALDGVTVENDMELTHGNYHFPKGKIELTGKEALVFSRIRSEDPRGDFGRQIRQKQIIEAMINKAANISTLWKYNDIFKALGDNVKTNFTFSEIVELQKTYSDVRKNIEQLRFEGRDGGFIGDYWYYFANTEEVQALSHQLKEHLGLQA
ncbi:LCP family protein [Fervidibacillus halotolerans]|uniref:LCP family protein n=1 Tax=Fervidibacillus halotolerans TaxID=2980027 RepID=A0A9E8LXZ2_9BACI|nr:LCP family protein [Fervidibacillus halotolerans]WAA11770.1 LCP family protein [Fervidibacillus halotolerans]